jgi:hypothetical protein
MKTAAAFQIHVESEATRGGLEMPRRFCLDGRTIEIVENIDQWHGPGYCYFKVKGEDGNLCILRLDEGRAEWELTMFQSAQAEPFATQVYPGKRQQADR